MTQQISNGEVRTLVLAWLNNLSKEEMLKFFWVYRVYQREYELVSGDQTAVFFDTPLIDKIMEYRSNNGDFTSVFELWESGVGLRQHVFHLQTQAREALYKAQYSNRSMNGPRDLIHNLYQEGFGVSFPKLIDALSEQLRLIQAKADDFYLKPEMELTISLPCVMMTTDEKSIANILEPEHIHEVRYQPWALMAHHEMVHRNLVVSKNGLQKVTKHIEIRSEIVD